MSAPAQPPSYQPSPTQTAGALPPGARLKGTRRMVAGWVLAVLGVPAACGGITGSYDKTSGNPLGGGLLFIVLGAWLIWWGRRLRAQRIVVMRPPKVARQSAAPYAAPAGPARQEFPQNPRVAPFTPPASPSLGQVNTAQASRGASGHRGVTDDRTPPRPVGTQVEAWAPGRGVEIEGEWARAEAFIRLLGHQPGFHDWDGAETHGDAVLMPDPMNPYGHGRAVAVFLGGEHVGYLAQQDADAYHPRLAAMHADGLLLRAHARAWASQPDGPGGRVNARVTVTLPEPAGLLPSNGLPDDAHVVIPTGRSIQVTKEEEHMDILRHYVLRGSGTNNYVAATLRSINEIRPRSSYECVQVEIDGQRVGVLTKGQSDKMLPLVRHIEQRGLVPVVRATVRGTKLQADVVIHCADSQTIDDDWLDGLGDQVAEANIDKMPPSRKHSVYDWDDDPRPVSTQHRTTTSPDW